MLRLPPENQLEAYILNKVDITVKISLMCQSFP